MSNSMRTWLGWLARCGIATMLSTPNGGCHDVLEYGLGTPCDLNSPCREPLVCTNDHCAMPTAAIEASAGHSTGTDANASMASTAGSKWNTSGNGGMVVAPAGTGSGGSAGDAGNRGTAMGPPSTSTASAGSAAGSARFVLTTNAGSGGTWAAQTTGTTGEPWHGAGIGAGAGDASSSHRGASGSESGGAPNPISYAGSSTTAVSYPPYENGHNCSYNEECQSDHCVDRVCCDTECSEQCAACNLEGHRGDCMLIPKGQPLPNRRPCDNNDSICGGSCQGKPTCSYPDSSQICDANAECLDTIHRRDALACDGSGRCTIAITSTCSAPEFCNMNTDSKCGPQVFTQLDVTQSLSCAVVSNGTVQCWGSNNRGSLGYGEAPRTETTPLHLEFLMDVTSVATGWGHTCALRKDGRVSCWGANFNGDLGCDHLYWDISPTCATFLAGSGVTALVAGGEHSCALLFDGQVKCWGFNNRGQAGKDNSPSTNGNTINDSVFSPTLVKGITNATQLAASVWHTCARLIDGSVRCWGNNEGGELASGKGVLYSWSPLIVFGLDGVQGRARAVFAGGYNTCFILDDQTIACAGDNSSGQLGTTGIPNITIPMPVQWPMTAQSMAIGFGFMCAVESPTSVKCWGKGDHGQLGNGEYLDSTSPVAVALPENVQVRNIVSIYSHTCVLSDQGRIWCWGDNADGQLGNGTITDSSIPVEARIE